MRYLVAAASVAFAALLCWNTQAVTASEAPITLEVSGAASVKPDTDLASTAAITNNTDKPVSVSVDYTIQHDANWYNIQPPDPVYGSDEALGKKSWTVADGKTIDEGAITDNKKWTAAETEYSGGHWTEAFQYIDLGKPIKVNHMTWEPGDANWIWKVDVSASTDGKTYTPIPSLQNVDLYKRFYVLNVFPLAEPVEARFLQFRYHKNGEKVNVFRMPTAIHVYDGTADESFDLPKVGREFASGHLSADVAPGEKASLPMTAKEKLTPGAYLVSLKAKAGDQTYITWRHLAVMPEAFKQIGESRFGFNSDTDKVADLLEYMGIGWVRYENLKGPFVTTEPGKYAFDGSINSGVNVDAIFKNYREHGINILPPFLVFPSYADHPKGTKAETYRLSPDDIKAFADFCYQSVARYGATKHPAGDLETADKVSGLGYVQYWEVWNEQNHGNFGKWGGAAKYYDFFRVCAEAIKKADPTAKVTHGGFSGIGVKLFADMLNHKYPDGKTPLDFIDVLNVHFYTAQAPPELGRLNPNTAIFNTTDAHTFEENMDLLRQWRDDFEPSKPIWMTETGYETDGTYGVDDHTQAAWMPRDLMLILARGVDKVMVFRDIGSGPARWASAGVLRDDLSEKPSFFTYATLIHQLNGVDGYGLQVFNGDDNVRIYAWQRGGQTMVSAWAINGTAPLKLNLGQATMTDAFGDVQKNVDTGSLTLTTFPVYLSDCTDQAAVKAMVQEAQKRRDTQLARHQAEMNQTAYLYGFGAKEGVGGALIGKYRPATGITADEVYDNAKGYGFFPEAGLEDGKVYRSDDQNKHAVKISKEIGFKFMIPPGRYTLKVGLVPFKPTGQNITIGGIAGGAKTLPITKADPSVTLEVQVGGQPITINTDYYGMLSWINVVQTLPPPGGEGGNGK